MKILVLGAGMMGRAAAFDLSRSDNVKEIIIADIDEARAAEVRDFTGSRKVQVKRIDISDFNETAALMAGCHAVIGAVTYRYNYELSRAAVQAEANLCDLGGNNTIVEKQFSLDGAAKERGITIIPDCGLAPGMVSILTAHADCQMDRLDEVHLRVGGLPQHPKPPLNYKIVFSPSGLINEYKEDAVVIRDGAVKTVPPMAEVEEIEFPEPFGKLEAFTTSGGISTLPKTYAGRVRALDYKTIRYRGHCRLMKALFDIGLAGEAPIQVGGIEVVPRQFFESLLLEKLSDNDRDVILVRVTANGMKGNKREQLTYTIIDFHDEKNNVSAMMRMTAYPASIIAQMLAAGAIRQKGVVAQECCVEPDQFLEELRKRDIEINIE